MNRLASSPRSVSRTRRHRASLCVAAFALLFLSACAQTTMVVLVRHAEPAASPPGNPPLSAAGVQRAQALVEVVRESGLSAVFHTQFARTTQTATIVASALSVPNVQIDVTPGQEQQHADTVRARILDNFGGRNVLVVGHSNTIDLIATALGVSNAPTIGTQDFGNLLIVVRRGRNNPVRLVHGRYGS